METKRVVITGMGMITPLGNTREESWKAALSGQSGIGPITKFDASQMASQIAGEVKGFVPEDFIDKKDVKKQALFSHYAVACTKEAWADAGLESADYDPARMGCVLGVGMGGLDVLEKYHEMYLSSGPRKISPFLIPSMISNLAAGSVGIHFGLKGVNFVTSSACTSATHAIGEAYRMIKTGVQDVMVTGGSESTVSAMGIGGFCALKALSSRNEEPEKASRPFDKGRDGFVLSEGAVILILEDLERAKARGAKIYAEVSGYGVSSDAYHMTAPCVDGAGAVECMRNALSDAALKAEDIQYVNAHGTSTPSGDVAETTAIKTTFGEYANNGLLVSSTKSMTGHLLGAAGAIEAGFCALAVRDGEVPPTINLDDPEEGCDLDYVPHTSRKASLTHTLSNSFGFGGTNATLVISKVG